MLCGGCSATGRLRFYCDAPRAQREASRQLNLIFHFVPIHPRLQGGSFSAHIGKINACPNFEGGLRLN